MLTEKKIYCRTGSLEIQVFITLQKMLFDKTNQLAITTADDTTRGSKILNQDFALQSFFYNYSISDNVVTLSFINPLKENAEYKITISDDYKDIYPDPTDIAVIPTTSLAEVRRTKAPTVLVETAFHDNPEDADWIRSNIDGIARSISKSIAEYLGVPFVTP